MWNNEFMGGGGGGGAGFLNSPGNFGTQMGSSPKDKKPGKKDNVVPCTVAHLHATVTEHVTVGSLVVNNLTVVGLVLSVDEQSTRIIYQLDDMTGPPIEVQFWMGDGESDRSSDQRSRVLEGSYIRVLGSLRSIQDKKMILAYKVVPLTDLNELSMHLLEVIHTNMAIALMDKTEKGGAQTLLNNKMNTTPGIFEGKMSTSDNSVMGGEAVENAAMHGMNAKQKRVFQVLLGATSEEGMHIDAICDTVLNMSRMDVRMVIEFLCNEGHIYSTVDDDHFKATDSV